MRINIGFDGTYGDVFFSIVHNKIFVVEHDWEELIGLYGGGMYYFSKSLLSGGGFLDRLGDLIRINNQFPRNFQHLENFKIFKKMENKNLFCFVDAGYSHKAFDGNVIITDGDAIAICNQWQVCEIVKDWDSLDFKKKVVKLYAQNNGKYSEVEFKILNERKSIINPATFIIGVSKFCGTKNLNNWVFHPRINLFKIGESYYHRNKVGYFNKKWDFDPTQVVGEKIGNWVVFHPGVVYARYDNMVAWITAADRQSFCKGKYSFEEGGSVPLLDYEATCSVWGFFDKTPEYFNSFLLKKAKEDFIFNSKRMSVEKVKRILEEHQDGVLTVQDSLAVGNCEPATNLFIKEFNIQENEGGMFNVKDVLENSNIDKMLKNFNFRKVIANKFM